MPPLKHIIAYLLGAILILGGIGHFASPEISSGFIPDFLPKAAVHIVIGLLELALGIAVFVPKWRGKALLGVMLLMIGFLPLHDRHVQGGAGDWLSDGGVIRVPVQLLLIAGAWYGRK
ncbi:MAG: hypothetical protein R3B47_11485 [Bacteroidia bacterium]